MKRGKLFGWLVLVVGIVMGMPCACLAAEVVANGYSGGCGGQKFLDELPTDTNGVASVIIRSGEYVDSLQMIVKVDGSTKHLTKHGGDGGSESVFTLSDGEYIKRISGSYGSLVDSIQFETNLQTSQKYGREGGCAEYNYEAPDGYEIAGFYGRSGRLVDAIGVVLRKR